MTENKSDQKLSHDQQIGSDKFHLICGDECNKHGGDIIVIDGLARCVPCPFGKLLDESHETKKSNVIHLHKRRRVTAKFWQDKFLQTEFARRRAIQKIKELRREVRILTASNLQLQPIVQPNEGDKS